MRGALNRGHLKIHMIHIDAAADLEPRDAAAS